MATNQEKGFRSYGQTLSFAPSNHAWTFVSLSLSLRQNILVQETFRHGWLFMHVCNATFIIHSDRHWLFKDSPTFFLLIVLLVLSFVQKLINTGKPFRRNLSPKPMPQHSLMPTVEPNGWLKAAVQNHNMKIAIRADSLSCAQLQITATDHFNSTI